MNTRLHASLLALVLAGPVAALADPCEDLSSASGKARCCAALRHDEGVLRDAMAKCGEGTVCRNVFESDLLSNLATQRTACAAPSGGGAAAGAASRAGGADRRPSTSPRGARAQTLRAAARGDWRVTEDAALLSAQVDCKIELRDECNRLTRNRGWLDDTAVEFSGANGGTAGFCETRRHYGTEWRCSTNCSGPCNR